MRNFGGIGREIISHDIKLAGENWLATKRSERLDLSFHHAIFMLPSSASVCDIIARCSLKARIYKQIYKTLFIGPCFSFHRATFILNLRQI